MGELGEAQRCGCLFNAGVIMARTQPDAGLQQIDDLERNIILGREETWRFNGVSDDEIGRLRPGVVQLAKNVTDRLRAEYGARKQAQRV